MNSRLRVVLVLGSIVVAAIATWLWLRSFDVSAQDIDRLRTRMVWWPLPLLAGLIVAHVTLASWRWSLIDRRLGGPERGLRESVAVGAFALGLGTFLPAPLINVFCRSLANKVSGTSALRGALSGSIDQAADFAAVLLLAGPATLAIALNDVEWYFILSPVAILAALAAIWAAPAIARRLSACRHIPPRSLILLVDRPLLLTISGVSLLRTGNLVLMTLAVHWMTGAASTMAIIVGVPLVTVAISLAMLPGSFGISEWSFSAVFAAFGTPPDEIVLFVLANRLVLTTLSLVFAAVMTGLMLGRWKGSSRGAAQPAVRPCDKSL